MSRILYTPRIRRLKQKTSVSSRILFWIAGVVIVCALLIFGFFFAVYKQSWHIAKVETSGLETLSQATVEQAVGTALAGKKFFVIPRASFFVVSGKSLERSLIAALPKIKSASISKIFPDTVNVAVTERKFWGVVCKDPTVFGTQVVSDVPVDSATATDTPVIAEAAVVVTPQPTASSTAPLTCVYVDDEGIAYDHAPDIAGALLLKVRSDEAAVEVGAHTLSPDMMNTIRTFADKVTVATGGETLTGVELSSKIPSEIHLRTSAGYILYINKTDNFTDVFTILRRVLTQEIGPKRKNLDYIDLRFGNKVFYKLK